MGKTLNVLIARNSESFSFLYQEVIDSFQHVCFFDPETEIPHLEGIDLLYLPGVILKNIWRHWSRQRGLAMPSENMRNGADTSSPNVEG